MGAWLVTHELSDGALSARLEQIAEGLQRDRVTVAFVAEFSRGKSELINAIFFATQGRRIIPASAGRTTMCPTELGYDASLPACLRLLPIETRLETRPLTAWRLMHDAWTRVPLEVGNPEQMARALETVAQVRRVSIDAARSLGFWHDETPDDNPVVGEDGLVEVPMWRHALVNIDHPLLRQGLVVLDTPGLNAIGAEPDLTVQLLAEAHAVVFLLAADAGVSKSDLQLWRDYVATGEGEAARAESRVVVLNKIDVLWDGISTAAQVQAQVERQRATSASLLGVQPARVIPVSAQRALVARINGDAAMLQASGLTLLETVLAQGIVERRHAILRASVAGGIARVRTDTTRLLTMRRREIDDQVAELRSLRGKNDNVIASMRTRVESEQREFDTSEKRVQALHLVRLRLLREMRGKLGVSDAQLGEFVALQQVLSEPGLKLGARRAYHEAFGRAAERVTQAVAAVNEIHAMLEASFRQLNAEFGFSLQVPPAPGLGEREQEIRQIEKAHEQYVSVGNTLRLIQPTFGARLARALASRAQAVLGELAQEAESWSRAAVAPVDTQLRERRKGFVRRIEAIDRIRNAASGLGDRMDELKEQSTALGKLEAEVRAWATSFENVADAGVQAAAASARREPVAANYDE